MAFDYAVDRENTKISGRKSWFFFEEVTVCLSAGIDSDSQTNVITSVNQCLLDGPITLGGSEKSGSQIKKGERSRSGKCWVRHDGVGYVFPRKQAQITIRAKTQKGSWHRIRLTVSDKPVKKDVFSLWLNHGAQPSDTKYRYFVVPAAKPAELDTCLGEQSPTEVLANRPELQAVARRDQSVV